MSNLHILLHKISWRPRGVYCRLDGLIGVITKGWWTDCQLEGCVLPKVVLWLATIALMGVDKHPGEIVVAPMMDYFLRQSF